jgi:hypothetical protein
MGSGKVRDYLVFDRKLCYSLYNNKLCYNSTGEESGLTQQAALDQNRQHVENKAQ